jgi:hypothetical protein
MIRHYLLVGLSLVTPILTGRYRYPGRTTDEVGEDDAFHTIFFTDIAEYLKALPTATSTLLVEAFLCFCGLPPLPRAAEHQRTWWTDSFLQHHHSKSSSHDGEDAQIHQSQRRFSETPLKLFQMTSHLLFDQEFSLDPMRLDASFVRRLLSLIACEPASEDVIGEYLLAFETRHFPSEVPKTYVSSFRTFQHPFQNSNGPSHISRCTRAPQTSHAIHQAYRTGAIRWPFAHS